MSRLPVVAVLAFSLVLPASVRAEVHLEPVDVVREGDGLVGLAGVQALVVSADGGDLYAVAPSDDAVAQFRRDGATGALTPAGVVRDGVAGVDGLDGAAALALSPDGDHLYVAASEANAVTVFRRDRESGALTFVETHLQGRYGVDGLTYAGAVIVSPDGQHVYATGHRDNALVIFARNGLTGSLRYLGTVRDDDGLAGVQALGISPDGRHLYAAGMNDGAIAAFRRDRATGALRFVEAERDLGLAGTHAVAVSPDGHNVYATGQADSAVVVFRRDTRTGGLSAVDLEADDVDGARGILGALALALSRDGKQVYVTGSMGNSAAVFRRDLEDGTLAFQSAVDRAGGVDTLACARAVAVSPDGGTVYVGGASSNAVTAFRVVGR